MKVFGTSAAALLVAGLMVGCTTAPRTEQAKQKLENTSDRVMSRIHQEDPSLQEFLNKSSGYVVFPSIGKGGFLVGGAYGRGIVYENGAQVGWADLSEASVGAQVGGQQYALIVAFENKTDVDRFKSGKFTLGANASAVALKSGVAKSTRFQDGTAVFVYPLAGGMVEAAVAGKSLTYVPTTGERANNPDRPGDRPNTVERDRTTTIERDVTTTTRPADRR